MKTEKQLKEAYKLQGYTEEEIEKIIKSRKAVDEGKVISAEEMYRRLLVKEKAHA